MITSSTNGASCSRGRRPRQSCQLANRRGQRPRLQVIQIFNHFLHAADYERETVVIEFVGRVI
jgi:hypothetical protein